MEYEHSASKLSGVYALSTLSELCMMRNLDEM
jgi:hypothetical protein